MPILRIYDLNTKTQEIQDEEKHEVANKEDAIVKLYDILRKTADHQWAQELVNDFTGQDVAEKRNYGNDVWMLLTRVEYLDD